MLVARKVQGESLTDKGKWLAETLKLNSQGGNHGASQSGEWNRNQFTKNDRGHQLKQWAKNERVNDEVIIEDQIKRK